MSGTSRPGGRTEPWYKALMTGLGTGAVLVGVVFLVVVMLDIGR